MKTLDYPSFHALAKDLKLLIRPARLDKWRVVFPNAGELRGFPHFGTVLILCTDGTEAYFHVGRDTIFHGHLKAFTGPVTNHYVWADDWDFERSRPRVHVFKKRVGKDTKVVVIPFDKEMEEYKEMHPSYIPMGKHPEDDGYTGPTESQYTKVTFRASLKQKLLDTL